MSNARKRKANLANSRKSTGPKTEAGKGRVSKNAVKHGLRGQFHLIATEDRAEFEEFRGLLHEQLNPSGALEQALTERIITAFWRLRRVVRIEAELIDKICEDTRERKQRDSVLKEYDFVDAMAGLRGAAQPESAEVSLGEAMKGQMQMSDVIGKFYRYEAHIERGMYRALHELQRLQTVRRGGTIPAPVAVDITTDLNSDKPPSEARNQ